jgi:hypothetical protein
MSGARPWQSRPTFARTAGRPSAERPAGLRRATGLAIKGPTTGGAMSSLHQFKMEYSAEQDRILFRMSTTDDTEIRLWFTRRFIKRFWGVLTKLTERDPTVVTQTDPVAKRSVVAFQRESAVAQTDFSKTYEEKSEPRLPLGVEPVLVTRLKATPQANGHYQLSFAPEKGNQVNITLNSQYLHSLTYLLLQVVRKTDWDLTLEAAEVAAAQARPARLM